MKGPVTRRLEREAALMQELAEKSSLVQFGTNGQPPTEYSVNLRCGGLRLEGSRVEPTHWHSFLLRLTPEFPLAPPRIVWLTPIFHPNFRMPDVCVGDAWYPGSSLAALCEVVCEMVQYKKFNIYDPLNREAAEWLEDQLERRAITLPVDAQPVYNQRFDMRVAPAGRED